MATILPTTFTTTVGLSQDHDKAVATAKDDLSYLVATLVGAGEDRHYAASQLANRIIDNLVAELAKPSFTFSYGTPEVK